MGAEPRGRGNANGSVAEGAGYLRETEEVEAVGEQGQWQESHQGNRRQVADHAGLPSPRRHLHLERCYNGKLGRGGPLSKGFCGL